jgi:hypothetical protein
LRKYLLIVQPHNCKQPERLEDLLADELRYIWNWLMQVSNRRSGTGFGPATLTQTGLLYWRQLWRLSPPPFEIEAIDDLYITQQANGSSNGKK